VKLWVGRLISGVARIIVNSTPFDVETIYYAIPIASRFLGVGRINEKSGRIIVKCGRIN
jgi:hypothetical protein